jgi:hypothetical protein
LVEGQNEIRLTLSILGGFRMVVSGLHHYENSRLMKVILLVPVDSHDPTFPLNILPIKFVLKVFPGSLRWHSLATVIYKCLPRDL